MRIVDFEEIFAGRKPKPYGIYHYFSVLVPLVQKDGELHLLFEVRADGLKNQPGEVCFPGGKMEKDETAAEGARRETSEELNIPEDRIHIFSELDYIHTYSNFTLYSFLGVIDYEDIIDIHVNKDEVNNIFLVPFDFFLNNDPYVTTLEVSPVVEHDFPYDLIKRQSSYNWRKGRTTIPIYNYEGNIIWGLTGKIIQNIVKIVSCSKDHENAGSSNRCHERSMGG